MQDLASGEIDAGVLWGPMAGYYAKQASTPLRVVPLVEGNSGGPRLAYRIAMGVRFADQNWKRQLNRLIQENQPEINASAARASACRCSTRRTSPSPTTAGAK